MRGDRYGDVIDPDGLEITNYQKNPIVLFSHDPTLWIGQTKQLFHEKGGNVNRWLADVQFASNALGDECEQGAAAGILVATSIGFNPLAEPRKLSGQPSATGGARAAARLVQRRLLPAADRTGRVVGRHHAREPGGARGPREGIRAAGQSPHCGAADGRADGSRGAACPRAASIRPRARLH